MQRDSDTADSGKPRVVLYCVKRSLVLYYRFILCEKKNSITYVAC